jgi:hypothetical protein
MSMGGRATARQRMLQRAGLIAGVLVLIALLLIVTGHWILGIIFGAAAVLAVALFRALRTVR